MKIRDLLTEEQRFDFDKHRDTILRFVKNTLEGKPNNRQYNPFYELIVAGGRVGAAEDLGLDSKVTTAWRQYFQSKPFIGGAGEPWSQINIGDQYAKATGDNRTLNFYVTVSKDRGNILKFFKNYHSLASYLQPISQKYQTPIKFKTHSILDSFIGHNDSFKVYYYDPKVKNEVVGAVKKWLSDSGISTAARSHEHGVDTKTDGSFGEILSKHVYDEFTKLIKTHGAKVTPEKYFEWLKENLPVLIKQVKPNEQMTESWSKKYKKSINCSNPKGFSQRAHCAGRRARKAGKKTKSKSVSESLARAMSTADMIAYLRQHHDKNLHQDYLNYINKFDTFELRDVPINSINTDLPKLEKEKVEKYGQMDFSKAPPIVMGDGYILDGFHRANVAKSLGIPSIKAYVGVKKSVSETTVNDIHKLADQQGVKWDNDDKFMAKTKQLTGKEHLDDLTPAELLKVQAWLKSINENFADGKKPGRKGLAKRSGVNCKQSVSKLRSIAKHSTGEKRRMAHWCSNMKSGKKK